MSPILLLTVLLCNLSTLHAFSMTTQPKYQTTWEPTIASLIHESLKNRQLPTPTTKKPFLVALVGIPGSGKSTSATLLSSLLTVPNTIMPMDGYHYPMSTLEQMDNAQECIYRRGAPDTFDAFALKNDLNRLIHSQESHIWFPGFDHAKGDPSPKAHEFDRNLHQVVICEGLYLLHQQDGWEGVSDVFDLTIYIDSNLDKAVERLKIRNRCIPGYTVEEIEERCEIVDRKNALLVEKTKVFADRVVISAASHE